MKAPRILHVEVLHAQGGRRHLLVTVQPPEGAASVQRMVDDHGDAVAVLPYDPERRVALLTRQTRIPPALAHAPAAFPEAPAGMIDAGEAAETAAVREVEEETGLVLAGLEPAGRVWSSPGVTTERVWLFLAPYAAADRRGAGGGLAAEHEHITVEEHPLDVLAAWADAGELVDLKTLALVQTLRLRRAELFAPQRR